MSRHTEGFDFDEELTKIQTENAEHYVEKHIDLRGETISNNEVS